MQHPFKTIGFTALAVIGLGVAGWFFYSEPGAPVDVEDLSLAAAPETPASPLEKELLPLEGVTQEKRRSAEEPAAPVALAAPVEPKAAPSPDPIGDGELVIEVFVRDSQGHPIECARVWANPLASNDLERRRKRGATPTNADGWTRLWPLQHDSYRVVAEAEGYAASPSEVVKLTLNRPHGQTEVTMTVGGSVVGVLPDNQGEPAAGIPLSIHLRAWPNQLEHNTAGILRRAETGEDGSFEFLHLAEGSYTLRSRAQGEDLLRVPGQRVQLEVKEGEVTQVDFNLRSSASVNVTGVVLENDLPVPNARLGFSFPNGPPGLRTARTKADEGGRFEINLDGGGQYRVQVSGGHLGGSVFTQADIPNNPVHEIEVQFSTGRIQGRVLGPDGNPISDYALMASGRSPDRNRGSAIARATTNAEGAFEFSSLLAATYSVRPGRDMDPRSMLKSSNTPFVGEASVSGLVVEAGVTLSDVELQLPAAAAVEVFVTDPEGNPISGAKVSCGLTGTHFGFGQHGKVTTDHSGRALLGGLPAGEYLIHATREREVSDKVGATLAVNSTQTARLILKQGTIVEVEVQSAGEVPERGFVRLQDADGRMLSAAILANGKARLGPLTAGSYVVHASTRDGNPRVAEQAILVSGQESLSVSLDLR